MTEKQRKIWDRIVEECRETPGFFEIVDEEKTAMLAADDRIRKLETENTELSQMWKTDHKGYLDSLQSLSIARTQMQQALEINHRSQTKIRELEARVKVLEALIEDVNESIYTATSKPTIGWKQAEALQSEAERIRARERGT